jgi:mono/diheme cytochrome c family protein
MSTRMVLSIAFVLFVVLGMVVYVLNEGQRADYNILTSTEDDSHIGAELFAANCSQCHGPKGEGAIGPALDRPEWHAGDVNYDQNAVTTFLRNVIHRGQYSPQPGITMPAWSKDYSGPLNDEEIEKIIVFITQNKWEKPLQYTSTPNYTAAIPANSVQKQQYPSTTAEVLAAKNPDKYGGSTPNADQKKALTDDAKREEDAKGPAYQEAQKNAENLRLLLGNPDPNKPGEALNGIKQLIQLKGCVNCHAFGSVGTTLGPSLTEVGSRRDAQWLNDWIKNPSLMPASNRGPNVMPWFKGDNRTDFWPMQATFMPTIPMTDQERQRIVDYLSNLKTAAVALPQATPTANPTANK